MFRPNRIGDHPIVDVSAADFTLPQSDAENLASLGTMVLHQVQTDTATLGDPVSCVNFNTGDGLKTWSISSLKSWSFGRFITGAALNNREMMISYSLNATLTLAAVSPEIKLQACIGVANATSVTVDKTAQVNLMDTRVILGMDLSQSELTKSISVKGTIVNSLFNGGASGEYDTNPIGLWLAVVNTKSSGAAAIKVLSGSLSLYRYSVDIDTFDPTR